MPAARAWRSARSSRSSSWRRRSSRGCWSRGASARPLIAGATALGLWLGGWALIGFDGLTGYPHLLSRAHGHRGRRAATRRSPTRTSSASRERRVARALRRSALPAGRALGRAAGGARAATRRPSCSACSSLLAFSPIVWHHYLVLLFIPLAVYCPRFAPIWLLPLVCWIVWKGAFFYTGWAERLVFLAVIAGHHRLGAHAPRRSGPSRRAAAGTIPAWR